MLLGILNNLGHSQSTKVMLQAPPPKKEGHSILIALVEPKDKSLFRAQLLRVLFKRAVSARIVSTRAPFLGALLFWHWRTMVNIDLHLGLRGMAIPLLAFGQSVPRVSITLTKIHDKEVP